MSPSQFLSCAAGVAILTLASFAGADEPVVPSTPPVAPSAPMPDLPSPGDAPPPDVAPPGVAPAAEPPREEPAEPPSEGRQLVSLYNSGFQWGLAPGLVFSGGKAGFFLGIRLGYGIDTGSVIIVPGVRLAGYFTDPNVYVGMPVVKVVFPIDRFAPFIEGGAGIGHLASPATNGAALFGGGGFMVHFNPRLALGAEANYQVITGTGFKGFGVGPIIAIGF